MTFKKQWKADQRSLALSMFGNHKKEFVVGQKLNYTKQKRKNTGCYVIKAVTYLRSKKSTLVNLLPVKG